MRTIWMDIRFALRILHGHPGISLIAILSLGLGLGATTTIFSLVDGMYLRPFPVRDPDGLLWVQNRSVEGRTAGFSWLDYQELKKAVSVFSDVATQNRRGAQLEGQGEPEPVQVTIVSANYFPLLGVNAARGRLFDTGMDEGLTGALAVAIGDNLWRRRFGGDPEAIGKTIRMYGRTFTVLGVLPPDFRGLDRSVRTDIWMPCGTWKEIGNRKEFSERGPGSFEAVARLAPGAGLEQARAQLKLLSDRFCEEMPDHYRNRSLTVATEEERQTRRGPNPAVLLLAIVGLVVLIACANVAMLLLAQAEGRNHEISVRLALGVGKARLIRQLFTEGAVLAIFGTALALIMAFWLIPLLPSLLPPGPDFIRFDIRMDRRVLVVTLLTCLTSVLLFGLAPVLKAVQTDLMQVLKGRAIDSRRRFAARSLFVVSQAALTVVLLVSAALLARSFLLVKEQRIGFDTDKKALVMFTIVQAPRPEVGVVCDEIAQRVRALPGIRQAAYCRRMPLMSVGGGAVRDVVIPGRMSSQEEGRLRVRYNQVSADFLATAGTQLFAGRGFTAADGATGTRVALVNQTMARRYWADGAVVGTWIKVDNADTQVIGVVEDGVAANIHDAPESFLYFPFAQLPVNEVTFLVETAGTPASMVDTVKRGMRSVRTDLIFIQTTTLDQHLKNALYSDWLPAVLSSIIGLIGMILAAAGLFGVVLHGVNRRFREMGIRLALGASAGSLMTMVLRHGLILAAAGAVLGIAASLATGRLMSSLLYGVGPYDPASLLLSASIVLALALVASAYPAWKATRVDPALVLRAE